MTPTGETSGGSYHGLIKDIICARPFLICRFCGRFEILFIAFVVVWAPRLEFVGIVFGRCHCRVCVLRASGQSKLEVITSRVCLVDRKGERQGAPSNPYTAVGE